MTPSRRGFLSGLLALPFVRALRPATEAAPEFTVDASSQVTINLPGAPGCRSVILGVSSNPLRVLGAAAGSICVDPGSSALFVRAEDGSWKLLESA